MPDVGGHVISREFSRDSQLNNTHAVCNFTGTSMDNAALSSGKFSCINSYVIFYQVVFNVNLNKIKLKVKIMNECCL